MLPALPTGALAAVLAAGLASAQPSEDSWSIFRGDPALTGRATGSLPAELELLWTFEAGGAVTSSPVVADGRVVFGSDDGNVYALDAEGGEELWSFKTDDIVEAPPLILDGRVFVGSSDFFFYAIDARTGELAWKYEAEDKFLGGANYVRTRDGARVLVGSYDTNLYCFDPATGEKLWAYSTENYVNGTPAILGDRVIFGGCDAVLHVVSAATGEALGALQLGADCHVAGSAALHEGRAYFGHYGNQFVAVDLEQEELAWTYDSPRHAFFSSPAIGDDRIVFGGRDKKLHCVQLSDGKPLWTFPSRRKVDGSPVICGDAVVFGSGDGRMYVLGLADGKERWTYDIGQSILSSPAVVDGRIYIGANDGKLYVFGAGSSKAEEDQG